MTALVLTVCAVLAVTLLVRVAYALGVMKGARSMARVVISSAGSDHDRSYGTTTAGRADTGTGTTTATRTGMSAESGGAVPAQERHGPGTDPTPAMCLGELERAARTTKT